MADTKISALVALTSASTDDLLVIVDDPAGTPATKKITFDNLQLSITKVGTIATGVWQGTAVADAYVSSAATWNAKVGGSGTTNTLPLFTGSATLGDSILLQSTNTIEQRNGANAQTTRVYTSFTDASNYERLGIKTAAGKITLAAESAGTGSANISLVLTPKGTGGVGIGTDSPSSPFTVSALARPATHASIGANDGVGIIIDTIDTGHGLRLRWNGQDGPLLTTGEGASPMYSKTNDANTGIHLPGSDVIDLVTNGSIRASVDSSGNLNIVSGVLGLGSAGSPDTGLARARAAVVGLTNGSSAGGTWRAIPLSPAQITADQNNYAPAGSSFFYRLTSDASRNITGLSLSQVDGEVHEIWNVGSNDIVLVHESASSTAANRFTATTAANITLSAGQAARLWYDGTSARWRVSKLN